MYGCWKAGKMYMIYLRFLWSLIKHKWYVLIAGRFIGVPWWRLVIHDWQKFTSSEFTQYAKYFQGGKLNEDESPFMFAWVHHVHKGPHHWEYWLLHPDYNFSAATEGMIPMPMKFVREMVADWMGASKTYTGSWDIAVWLNEHGPKMRLHKVTQDHLATVMYEMEYFLTDNCDWSWMAGSKFRLWAGLSNSA